jgi:stage II sporulation protein D
LRRAAESALGGRAGVVLVMDAQTGRVRAAAGDVSAFEEATPPGSAVKPFTALAALASGALDEATRHSCRGLYEDAGLRATCAHPRQPARFDPRTALAHSCNDFFGRTAEALDPEEFLRTLEAFGFGSATGGGGGDEAAGLLPHDGARPAEMLGESERLRVTPAQLLSAYAALFNGGRVLVPTHAPPANFTPRERGRVRVEPSHRALLYAGMRGAVSYGTAARAGLAALPARAFGKTGTATPLEGFRQQGWFVGLAGEGSEAADVAPAPETVRLAVLVFLKRAHGSDAAAAARPVFEEYARTLKTPAATANAVDDGDADKASGPVVRVRLSRAGVVATLALEDYVFGVLAAEGSVEDEAEALKALAVVSRTYALRNLRRHAREHFDLCDTTHCQRYLHVRDPAARPDFYALLARATRETAGEVLRDSAGRTAEAYFSASCGGATADIRTLWGARHAPAQLRGGRDDACAADPHAWRDDIKTADLLRALRADARSDVGAYLDAVRVLRRDSGGRAELVELAGERRRLLRGWDFKIIVGRTLGWNVLKSSRFEVERAAGRFVFRGRGFGHGLGLCQAGAHQLAARGAGYRQILARYLPGTGLRIADEEHDDSHPQLTRASLSVNDDAPEPAIRNPQSAVLSSEHFRLVYPAGVARREAEAVLRELEAARGALSRHLERGGLGGAPDGVEVIAYETTGDFVGATGQPAWVAAVTEGRRVRLQPLAVLRRRGVLSATLRHELVHVACELLGGARAPRWLVEGLAAHFAGEGPSLRRGPEAPRLTLEELERRLARPASAAEMRALYAAAYRETLALIRREGAPAVWRRAAGR